MKGSSWGALSHPPELWCTQGHPELCLTTPLSNQCSPLTPIAYCSLFFLCPESNDLSRIRSFREDRPWMMSPRPLKTAHYKSYILCFHFSIPSQFSFFACFKNSFLCLLMPMLTVRQQTQLFCIKCFVERINIWQKYLITTFPKWSVHLFFPQWKEDKDSNPQFLSLKWSCANSGFWKEQMQYLEKGKTRFIFVLGEIKYYN